MFENWDPEYALCTFHLFLKKYLFERNTHTEGEKRRESGVGTENVSIYRFTPWKTVKAVVWPG